MRVYLPMTVEGLRTWHERAVATPPLPGWAVTPAVRNLLGDAGDEEAEYAVAAAAADASADLLRALDPPGDRRIVVVAEVADTVVLEDDAVAGSVTVTEPVPLAAVASVLADEAGEAGRSAGARADDALDLGWFGVQEIAALLA